MSADAKGRPRIFRPIKARASWGLGEAFRTGNGCS